MMNVLEMTTTDKIYHGLDAGYSYAVANDVTAVKISFSIDSEIDGYFEKYFYDEGLTDFLKSLPRELFKIKVNVYDPECYTGERCVERELTVVEMFNYLMQNTGSNHHYIFCDFMVQAYKTSVEWDDE